MLQETLSTKMYSVEVGDGDHTKYDVVDVLVETTQHSNTLLYKKFVVVEGGVVANKTNFFNNIFILKTLETRNWSQKKYYGDSIAPRGSKDQRERRAYACYTYHLVQTLFCTRT